MGGLKCPRGISPPNTNTLRPAGRRGLQARCYASAITYVFVARDEDGQLRKIPLPLKYAYGFVLAAIVGAFTIVGLAGSYTRMLLKTESFNQVRAERETLRQNYQRMEQIAHNRSVQVASLGALANEVTALYGLRENRLDAAKTSGRPLPGFGPRGGCDRPIGRYEPAAGRQLR